MSLVDALAALAFERAELRDANAAIAAAREKRAAGGAPALSYEIALPAMAPDEFLANKALPKLVYFLDCRGARLPATPGVFVSLFTPSGLYFIDAGAAVMAIAATRSLDADELVRRYGADGQGDPPLLGT